MWSSLPSPDHNHNIKVYMNPSLPAIGLLHIFQHFSTFPDIYQHLQAFTTHKIVCAESMISKCGQQKREPKFWQASGRRHRFSQRTGCGRHTRQGPRGWSIDCGSSRKLLNSVWDLSFLIADKNGFRYNYWYNFVNYTQINWSLVK